MKKIIKIFSFSLSIVGIVLWVSILSTDSLGVGEGSLLVDGMFIIAYLLIAIPLVSLLVFSISNMIKNPKLLKKAVLLLAATVVIVGVSYSLSDGTPIEGSTSSESSWVGTGLHVFYIMILAVVSIMIFFSAKRTLKR